MKRIHRDTDSTLRFTFTELTVSDVANIYFLLLSPSGEVLKKMATTEELPNFPSTDVTVVSETEVDVRILRSETVDFNYGKHTFQVRIAYENSSFEESKEIKSDAYPSFRVVADYEKTREGEGTDLNFILGGSGSLINIDGGSPSDIGVSNIDGGTI